MQKLEKTLVGLMTWPKVKTPWRRFYGLSGPCG